MLDLYQHLFWFIWLYYFGRKMKDVWSRSLSMRAHKFVHGICFTNKNFHSTIYSKFKNVKTTEIM